MADFDDHNPFRNDDDIVHTIPIPDSPEGSDVDLSSEPSTPPAHPARIPAASGTSLPGYASGPWHTTDGGMLQESDSAHGVNKVAIDSE